MNDLNDALDKAFGKKKQEPSKIKITRQSKWSYEKLLEEVINFEDFEKILDATTRNHARKVIEVLTKFGNNTNFQAYRVKAVIKIIEIIINRRK